MHGLTASYVLTTLLAAPQSSALTTLANVKDELDLLANDTSNDTRLNRFITEESDNIARYCNRVFGLATWSSEFRPQRGVRGEGVRGPVNPLKLPRWPLTTAAFAFTGNTHSNLLIDGIASTQGLLVGMPVFGVSIPVGATLSAVMPSGVLLSAPASATAAGVAFTAGLSVVETIADVSTVLVAGTDYAIDTGSLLPGDEGPACLYRLDENQNPKTWPAAKIVVIYQAGYALPQDADPTTPTVPSNLESACIRLVVGRFRARGRDPTLVQRDQAAGGIGTERFWVGAMPGNSGPYPNEIMAILNNYRVPVVA
jgi:hypothetical protein